MKSILHFTLAAVLACSAAAQEDSKALELPIDSKPIDRVIAPTPTSYAPMLKNVTPSVVSVYTSEIVQYVQRRGSTQDEMLRRLFGGPPPRRQAPRAEIKEELVPAGTGSGVIVSKDGYIITNNHVVVNKQGEEADEINVKLSDGNKLRAKIIGRDPKTDVAILKVEADDLPALTIADSDNIEVGDIVFAIGNPMDIGSTVTQGIVSARNRKIGIYGDEGYENFIQTDASINVGNSGGALVDTSGRLIGVNSAILSRSGGSVGIGFAIPSNLAVNISRQLAQFGKVTRGYLGVRLGDITSDIAEAFGLETPQGVLINEIEEGFPAEKAGLRRGDIITSINGKNIKNTNDFRVHVGHLPPGAILKLKVIRDGKPLDIEATTKAPTNIAGSSGKELFEGVAAAALDEENRQQFNIPESVAGILITEVQPDSPYARYLEPGVVILGINGHPTTRLSDARGALIRGANKIDFYRRGRFGYLALRIR